MPFLGDEICFYVGTPDADIDAPEAWALSTGTSVAVAVIDTGIDYTIPISREDSSADGTSSTTMATRWTITDTSPAPSPR